MDLAISPNTRFTTEASFDDIQPLTLIVAPHRAMCTSGILSTRDVSKWVLLTPVELGPGSAGALAPPGFNFTRRARRSRGGSCA